MSDFERVFKNNFYLTKEFAGFAAKQQGRIWLGRRDFSF